MNTQDTTTQIQEEQPKASTSRDAIIAKIREADIPVSAKKFALALLKSNLEPGNTISITTANLRKLSHEATNVALFKKLRRLQTAGIVAYSVNQIYQVVHIQFVVPGDKARKAA
jgi:hypothetical protein